MHVLRRNHSVQYAVSWEDSPERPTDGRVMQSSPHSSKSRTPAQPYSIVLKSSVFDILVFELM